MVLYVTDFLIEFLKKSKKNTLRNTPPFQQGEQNSGQKTQWTTHNMGRIVFVKPADFNK